VWYCKFCNRLKTKPLQHQGKNASLPGAWRNGDWRPGNPGIRLPSFQTFQPKSKGKERFWGIHRPTGHPNSPCRLTFVSPATPSLYPRCWAPLTCTRGPGPSWHPISQKGGPGGCVLNLGLQTTVKETWAEKQSWSARGCTPGCLFTPRRKAVKQLLFPCLSHPVEGWGMMWRVLWDPGQHFSPSRCCKGWLGFRALNQIQAL